MNDSSSNTKTSETKKSRFSKLTSFMILGAVLGALAAIVIFVFSESSTGVAASPKPVPTPPNEKRYVATKKIMVDRETGELRKPNAEELKELVETLKTMTRRPEEGLQSSSLTGGGQAVNLDGGFSGVMLARPNTDGGWEVRCVFTFEEGTEFLGLEEDVSGN